MPKVTKPVMGIPFPKSQEELRKFHPESAMLLNVKNNERRMLTHVFKTLTPLINPDTCTTEPQMEHIELLMADAGYKVKSGENADVVAARIATFINSIRLDCRNCLNEDCERRDPTLSSE